MLKKRIVASTPPLRGVGIAAGGEKYHWLGGVYLVDIDTVRTGIVGVEVVQAEFLALRERMDSAGRFFTPYLRTLFGLG